MSPLRRALAGASAMALVVASAAHAADPVDEAQRRDIVVTAKETDQSAPASRASIDADAIATTINAANAEDALKYLPSLIVRKRHIGDTQAPLATRTGGLGSSARSLIYADGALLSALIGNNNTNASPRWSIVSPEEIARIDVLYGPFSAAYPGNAIGAVVNITTRSPETLEATATLGTSVGTFDQYDTHRTLPAYQLGVTAGDRLGALSWFASYDHVASDSQPLTYVTAARPAAASAAGVPARGGIDTVNRTGAPIRVLGASGIEHQAQDRLKLKAALDLGAGVHLAWTGALFGNRTDAAAETYLTAVATGLPAYAGTFSLDGRAYTLAASAFSNGVYRTTQRHWSNAVSLSGSGESLDWRLIATRYTFDHDVQRTPTAALPGALGGGAGNITRLDGTGWTTLDGALDWRAGAHTLSAGAHGDAFRLASTRYATADWLTGNQGAANLIAAGRTRTAALWLEDRWALAPRLAVTLGGRQEWWRAYEGRNLSAAPALDVVQPTRTATRFSPKGSVAWTPAEGWTLRLSSARAWRFPTVGELYQIVTTPVPSVPDPKLRPERAWSSEAAVEYAGARGTARVSLFAESITDALVSQTGPLAGTTQLGTFVQNVARTRAHGVELAGDRRDLVPGLDLSGSVTWSDTVVAANPVLPASVGKQLPGVPDWKATLVATWRPTPATAFTAAARYASRIWGTLDHSDPVTYTYQAFDGYLVVDLRAQLKAGEHYTLGLGVDNVGGERYFLFHPFPQRTFRADLTLRL